MFLVTSKNEKSPYFSCVKLERFWCYFFLFCVTWGRILKLTTDGRPPTFRHLENGSLSLEALS